MEPIIKDQVGDVCRDLYVERDSLYALCELLENEFSERRSSHPDAYIICGVGGILGKIAGKLHDMREKVFGIIKELEAGDE